MYMCVCVCVYIYIYIYIYGDGALYRKMKLRKRYFFSRKG
jgi:hypothetical protein